MKKLFLFCFLLCSLHFSNAQKSSFQLQHNGTFLSPDGKDYIIFPYPEKTKNELYNQLLISISSMYVNPNSVISKVENEMISIRGYSPDFPGVTIKGILSGFYTAGAEYIIKIYFKDEKVKIDAPQIIAVGESNVTFNHWLNYHKVFKDGYPNPKHQVTIDHCNTQINALIEKIITLKQQSNNDW